MSQTKNKLSINKKKKIKSNFKKLKFLQDNNPMIRRRSFWFSSSIIRRRWRNTNSQLEDDTHRCLNGQNVGEEKV